MQIIEGRTIYSASDLNNYLDCAHLTSLDLQVASGEFHRPEASEMAQLISKAGIDHELAYLTALKTAGTQVTELESKRSKIQTLVELELEGADTATAMAAGAPVIYQGAFFDGQFLGRSDFLVRVDRPCEHWDWSYEVLDTKLALHEKPYFIIQLCHYSEHLARIQGTPPREMHVLLGNGEKVSWRVEEFAAYYRQLRRAFIRDVESGAQSYPLPVDHCTICTWAERCEKERRNDDHLSLVAWIRNSQIERLGEKKIATVAGLAMATDGDRPYGMEPRTFERLRRQAALQVEQRKTGVVRYELLEPREWFGFSLMPPPDTGDVFFDMEGDPLFEIGEGLEYLFGCWLPSDKKYVPYWGLDRAQEAQAFEQLVDLIVDRRTRYPSAHVYHYAPYETTALRRLAQRHRTREEELDNLLRGEVFVDLFAVVRQTMMVSQEDYSIKRLEPLYKFKRSAGVAAGDDSIVEFEKWRLNGEQAILDDIALYNDEDCRSTAELRDWLLKRREEAAQLFGHEVRLREARRPDEPCHPSFVEGCKACAKRDQTERDLAKTSDTQRRLLEGIQPPEDLAQVQALPESVRARYLLGNLLSYHRREEKPVFWQFYDRCQNADRLVEFDKDCLGGLEWDSSVPGFKVGKEQNLRYTYRFPPQLYNVEDGELFTPGDNKKPIGEVVEIDDDAGRVVVKLSREFQQKPQAVTDLVPRSYVAPEPQKVALQDLGVEFLGGLISPDSALMDLLLSRSPRLKGRTPGTTIQPETVTDEAVLSVIEQMDRSVLFIQGPPGTGKSTMAGSIIARLLEAGKRVGAMSNSHKAIHNLDAYLESAAAELGVRFRGVHKASAQNKDSAYVSKHGFIGSVTGNKDVDGGDYQFVSGNAWLLARPEMAENPLDYLFVDEAGQIALADAIAVAPSAKNLVFIGDPLQLAQVSQGIHPPGVGISVLEHLLGDRHTVAEDRGIFLDVTHRLHPLICQFVSDLIYDGRLRSAAGTARQSIGTPEEYGSGLRYQPLAHAGNSRESEEEAREVVRIAVALLGAPVVDENGSSRTAGPADIIVVTPYNAQRRLIRKLLDGANAQAIEVGTVDKFQGQQAFAVLYSTASSSAQDAPRGLHFLLDRNRFNVAISRARALTAVICSGALAESRAKSIDDIRALSLLCRYADSAQPSALGTVPA